MATKSVSNFPEDHDPFAPFYFVDHAEIQANRRRLKRARMIKHAGAAAFIAFVAVVGFFMSTEPAEAQPVECMACLTDPANDLPATRGDVYAVDVKTQTNAERIAQERRALETMIQTVKTDTSRRIEDVAALAGIADSRVLGDIRSEIAAVDRSAKQRDAAVLVSGVPETQIGETFALDLQIGTVGGETAIGAGASMSYDAGAARVVFGGSASTDAGGNEQAFVGKIGLRF